MQYTTTHPMFAGEMWYCVLLLGVGTTSSPPSFSFHMCGSSLGATSDRVTLASCCQSVDLQQDVCRCASVRGGENVARARFNLRTHARENKGTGGDTDTLKSSDRSHTKVFQSGSTELRTTIASCEEGEALGDMSHSLKRCINSQPRHMHQKQKTHTLTSCHKLATRMSERAGDLQHTFH